MCCTDLLKSITPNLKGEALAQLALVLAFRTIKESSISSAEGINSLKQHSGPPGVVMGLRNLMKVSRTLSARISLFLTLYRLRLRFLPLLEASVGVGSHGAEVSGDTPTQSNINESSLRVILCCPVM